MSYEVTMSLSESDFENISAAVVAINQALEDSPEYTAEDPVFERVERVDDA